VSGESGGDAASMVLLRRNLELFREAHPSAEEAFEAGVSADKIEEAPEAGVSADNNEEAFEAGVSADNNEEEETVSEVHV